MTQTGGSETDCFIYFKPAGDVAGESADKELKKENGIELLKFQLEVENQTNIGSAGNQGGKVRFEKCKIDKETDASTTGFFKACSSAQQFDEATIVVRKNNRPFMTVTMYKVVIANVQLNGEGSDMSTDSIELDYGLIEMTYLKQNRQGDLKKHSEAKWNRLTNKQD